MSGDNVKKEYVAEEEAWYDIYISCIIYYIVFCWVTVEVKISWNIWPCVCTWVEFIVVT